MAEGHLTAQDSRRDHHVVQWPTACSLAQRALSCFENEVEQAIRFASRGKDGDVLAALTGALLGSAHGVTPWMAQRFASHEFAWSIETLVQDAFAVAHTADEKPGWLQQRYPAA